MKHDRRTLLRFFVQSRGRARTLFFGPARRGVWGRWGRDRGGAPASVCGVCGMLKLVRMFPEDFSLGKDCAMRVCETRIDIAAAGLACVMGIGAACDTAPAQYLRQDLVSDVPGAAPNFDPLLINAWGLAFNPAGVAWVANNGTGTSTLYDGNGVP